MSGRTLALFDRLWSEAWRRADVCLALALIAFSTLVIVEANRLPPPFFDPLGSAAVPRFVAGLLIVLALAVLGRCLLSPVTSTRASDDEGVRPAPWTALGVVLVSVLYVGAMHYGVLDFAAASTLFVIALGALLTRGRLGPMLWMVPLAVIVGYGLNHLLTDFFYIDLPQRSIFTVEQ